jgi:hypothetical protein
LATGGGTTSGAVSNASTAASIPTVILSINCSLLHSQEISSG